MNDNRVQVKQEQYVEKKSLPSVDADYVRALGKHYNRYGDGPVDLTVAYDPKSRQNTAMYASNAMAQLVRDFRKNGIADVEARITPVNGLGDEAQVLVSFESYSAHAPKDCGKMAGYDDTTLDVDPEYRYGCTIETVFAKQIARPKDLKGQEQTDELTDGRRSSNVIEIHRTGVPNEPLGGESSSGN